jgi:hypothetical protein
MLSVEGYKVEWGADTTKFDEASRRVRATSAGDASFFAKEWDLAKHKAQKSIFGFANVARTAMGGVAAAFGLMAKGVVDFAASNEEAKHDLDDIKDSFKSLFVSIGADASGLIGTVGDLVELLKTGRDYFVDLFQGEGTAASLTAALKGRQDQDAQMKARTAITGKVVSARRDALFGHDVGDQDAIQLAYQERLAMARRAYDAEARSGDAVRISAARELFDIETAAAGDKRQNELEAYDAFWKGVRDKQEAITKERDAKAKAAEEDRTREQEAENNRQKTIAGEAQKVELARKHAQIQLLAATGRDKEARDAQIRLDTEERIADVMANQSVSLFARYAAADAISAAADAELGKATGKRLEQVGGSIASGGIGTGNVLSAQVFGGAGSSVDKQTTLAESQLTALKEIAKNTSQSTVGLIAP